MSCQVDQAVPSNETMHRKWPRRIWLPGALMEMIPMRMEEVGETTLSRYLVELISYDLRERREHSLMGWLATLPLETQQAIDLAIRCRYRPGFECNKRQLAKIVARGRYHRYPNIASPSSTFAQPFLWRIEE